MPTKELYARCEDCKRTFKNQLTWEYNEGFTVIDQDSPIIRSLQQHHKRFISRGHGRFRLFETIEDIKVVQIVDFETFYPKTIGNITVSSGCFPRGCIDYIGEEHDENHR